MFLVPWFDDIELMSDLDFLCHESLLILSQRFLSNHFFFCHFCDSQWGSHMLLFERSSGVIIVGDCTSLLWKARIRWIYGGQHHVPCDCSLLKCISSIGPFNKWFIWSDRLYFFCHYFNLWWHVLLCARLSVGLADLSIAHKGIFGRWKANSTFTWGHASSRMAIVILLFVLNKCFSGDWIL